MQPRKFLEIVLVRCPAYREALPDCALSQLRGEANADQQKERLEALSEEEVDECIRKHFLCLCRKNGCGT